MQESEIINKSIEIEQAHKSGKQYLLFVDFSRRADQHRLFIVDLWNKSIIYSWWTSHGSGSGSVQRAMLFSNINMSKKSSIGLMKIGVTYSGKYGLSRKLHGLESQNSNVEKRSIVLHQSQYVTKQYITDNKYPGRSWGCITLNPPDRDYLINLLVKDTLVFVQD